MKNISRHSPVAAIFLAFVLTTSSASVFAASVLSVTNKGTVLNETGEEIDITDVKCASASSSPRVIFSKVGERSWCSQDIPEICSRTKLAAAQRVCRSRFSAEIEEYKNNVNGLSNDVQEPTSAQSGLTPVDQSVVQTQSSVDDGVELEKQRLKIEQQKLEIRKQELELNKRRLELERQNSN